MVSRCVLVLVLCVSVALAQVDHTLRFREDGTFRIVQFTDLHFGEGDGKDPKTQDVQRAVLAAEKPDLVIMTGDSVSGFAWDGQTKPWFAPLWKEFTRPMTEFNARWAYALGNHDHQGDLTQDEIISLDQTSPLSLTQKGPADVDGVTNFVLPIYQGDEVLTNLWIFDSHDDGCLGVGGWGCVRPNQVAWYKSLSAKLTQLRGAQVPGLSFFHIPMPEFMWVWNEFPTVGNKSEDVSCFAVNTGLYAAMKEVGDMKGVFCGHDHNNDYGGPYYGIDLLYGRKTGYGCYGPPEGWQKGARVIEITASPFSYRTWIRQEDGSVVDQPVSQKTAGPMVKQSVCAGAVGGARSNCEAFEEAYKLKMALERPNAATQVSVKSLLERLSDETRQML
eukprot:GILJ01000539.1.p1 GENE.GILJ01000539.1~~GILJ01000539.1.p1  ORF type:complete len:403 (+),score=48.96 GILJ01000539.1:40-1209(+)